MKLSRALLCVNCSEVHDSAGACPVCGSHHSYFIAPWLDHPKAPDVIINPVAVIPMPASLADKDSFYRDIAERHVAELERLYKLNAAQPQSQSPDR